MTNTTKADESVVLKTDVLGRVKTPTSRRESLLDEFERGGLSGQTIPDGMGSSITFDSGPNPLLRANLKKARAKPRNRRKSLSSSKSNPPGAES